MSALHFPWLEAAVVLPLIGATLAHFRRNPDAVRRDAQFSSGLTLTMTIRAWQDFYLLHTAIAHDRWDVIERLSGIDLFRLLHFTE